MTIMQRPPKWTNSYIDRHGKPRFYLRRPGHRQIPLPGLPWSPEFMAAREAALKGEWVTPEMKAKRDWRGTALHRRSQPHSASEECWRTAHFENGRMPNRQSWLGKTRRKRLRRLEAKNGLAIPAEL